MSGSGFPLGIDEGAGTGCGDGAGAGAGVGFGAGVGAGGGTGEEVDGVSAGSGAQLENAKIAIINAVRQASLIT